MRLYNHTPFKYMTFQSEDLADSPFQVVVVKCTYDLLLGRPPELASDQEPVRTDAMPFEAEHPSSLREEDDLAPFKPRTDVLVLATSHAPGRQPAREWIAGITIGKISKQILVTGPRAWHHSKLSGWSLEAPTPTRDVAIRYELAYGGIAQRASGQDAYRENPIGRGFVEPSKLSTRDPIPAPTILCPSRPVPPLGGSYPIEGLSLIHRSWQPRLARAGTYDDTWINHRHPRPPQDFDYTFYNCAHPDLIYPGYLLGGEEVRLFNICRDHEVFRFKLPAHVIGVGVANRSGYRHGGVARLDTVCIDSERMRLSLVFRATLPLFSAEIARLDIVETMSNSAAVRARQM